MSRLGGCRSGARFRCDPRLLPRIRDMKESIGDECISAEDLAYNLQQKYPEYGRRKFRDFVKIVRIGVNMCESRVSESVRMEVDGVGCSQASSTENNFSTKERKRKLPAPSDVKPVVTIEDDSDSNDPNASLYVDYQDTNLSNKSLMKLYNRKSSFKHNGSSAESISASELKNSKKQKYTGEKNRENTRGLGGLPLLNVQAERSTVTFADLGGCEAQLLDVCRLSMHLKHPEIHERLGVMPPRGFLLHGPPGCGKTLFAQAVAGELKLPLIRIASTELVSGVSGESEEKIRILFAKAADSAPCVLLLDEVDSIAPKRETAQREMERRIVSQLISCLDDLYKPNVTSSGGTVSNSAAIFEEVNEQEAKSSQIVAQKQVLVIGTTNRPESIEPALRRAGRFDKEIALGIPDERARIKILEIVCRGIRLDDSVKIRDVARLTPGYVGADLKALAREASMCAVNRIFDTAVKSRSGAKRLTADEISEELSKMLTWLKSEEELDESKMTNLYVSAEDFERALSIVHPSAKREGFATVPDVTWEDIGALQEVREELQWSILYPIKRPEDFELLAISNVPQGILLCGPPGCGKTLLAKAVANETGINFISVKGPELLSMYVGESERAVRTVFQRARDSSPCIIFFDEIDALCPKRSSNEQSGSARLVNQLLTEMDGIEGRKQVFLIGATNRPDIVDPAILRPGRLDKILFVDFPNVSERADILRKSTKNGTHPRLSCDVSFEEIASDPALESFTGADLVALVHEASVIALKQRLSSADSSVDSLTTDHFRKAMKVVRASVSEKDRASYTRLKSVYGKK